MPSFQSVVQPDQRMRKFATTSASGAPAYMSTLALVMRPTSDLQLGNGRKQRQPTTNAVTSRALVGCLSGGWASE